LTATCAGPLATETEAGEHVGAGLALVAIEQLKFTVPLNPPTGVMVTTVLALAPALTVAVVGLGADREKPPPPGAMVSVNMVVWLSDPDVPITEIG